MALICVLIKCQKDPYKVSREVIIFKILQAKELKFREVK